MRKLILLLGMASITLAACESVDSGSSDASGAYISKLPDGVLAIAAPYQDLEAVRINQSDGCYVYRHAGPVETTFLPLRTVNGNPICTRKQ